MGTRSSKRRDDGALPGAVVGIGVASREAAATDELREGMAEIVEVAHRNARNEKGLKGILLERIEKARFNSNAARAGEYFRLHKDGHKSEADLLLKDQKGNVLTRFQYKFSEGNPPKMVAGARDDPKYQGQQIVTTSDRADAANAQIREWNSREGYQAIKGKVERETKYGRVSSGGTDSSELADAKAHPERYANRVVLGQVAREAWVTSKNTAIAGALMSGSLSSLRNFLAYQRGDIAGDQAVKNVTKDTVTSGVRSGSAGALGVGIRYAAMKTGAKVLAKSNVATAVASGIVDTAVTVYAYAKGEITGQEAGERLGGTACGTISGIGVGAAAGTILGPLGTVVGAIAGYVLSAQVYQSCVEVFKRAHIAEEDARRVVALCDEAVMVMEQQRKQFEVALADYLGKCEATFGQCFARIDQALITSESDAAVRALGDLLIGCGRTLQFETYHEFDRFMVDSDKPLVI